MRIICFILVIVFSFSQGFSAEASSVSKRPASSPHRKVKSLKRTAGKENVPSRNVSSIFQAGRFADNGDGTVTDSDTGLVWLKDADIRKLPITWEGAKLYIREMNYGKRPNFGYTDWRMPAINELQSLVDRTKFYPALPVNNPFVDIQNHFYWSSSTGRDIIDYVWILDMSSGEMTIDYMSACSYKFLWPVRSSWMPQKAVAGAIMTEGLNEYGQLGDGTTNSRDGLLPIGGMEDVIKVASGMDYSVAIKSDGSVWAWGRNNMGQLGNGTLEDSHIPVLVKELYKVTDVAAGKYHTLALRADGTVWAWGRNSYGQLGNGSIRDSNIPVKVKGLSNITAIAAGTYHSAAVRSDGTVWTWGWNLFGQIGDNTTKTRTEPVIVTGLPKIINVAAGLHYTLALASDGTVRAWGWNINGLLGDGTNVNRLIPVKVKKLSGIIDIAAGLNHSLALKKDGHVWAWGGNKYSQLGRKDDAGSLPSEVGGVGNIRKVAAGMYHSMALMKDGTIWIWGKDLKDQPAKSSPVRIWNVSSVNDIAGGKYFTLVVGGLGTKQ
ncbi:regulator of chromosome condensation (RCC1) repeat protein [bacterium BMS3Abin07]|nr:regulator of chromosome condensation (RCC1) repeat protein [bacterium BMS3Abin07]GBE33278.1 regulator of chromosome condensation (RCC1) repeat protein [bacterium BMS3Bbin05]HDL19814.1 DUF1566 domain-containing protein [Nitrospirota bacterium]HDO22574.1 DUF1566 domain-containing protein [Nitrospirota bacterium]HDZ87450.1 DUF1566 domain-containing protein [Nitrospirota bacterium]